LPFDFRYALFEAEVMRQCKICDGPNPDKADVGRGKEEAARRRLSEKSRL
jgi:hypothetical protein